MTRADQTHPTGGRGPLRTDGRLHVWRKLDLIHNGRTFLRRRGVDLRLGGILVHRIDAPDPGMDLHDHPWPFVTIILRGGYTEEFEDTRTASLMAEVAEWIDESPGTRGTSVRGTERTWRRWSIHAMPLNLAHRITATEPGTITLVLRGHKVRRWGFYLPTGWVDWEAYDYATRRPNTVDSDRPGERMVQP